MAHIIKTDGTRIPLEDLGLESLQAAVGGYIESICLPDGGRFYVNEDGKRLDLPRNEAATEIARACLYPGDFIRGDVVRLTPAEFAAEILEAEAAADREEAQTT
jgi:hypothetical protein